VNDIAVGPAGARPPGREGPLLEEISRRVVQLYKESYGRGPTKARTYWEDDVITVVVRGGFTPDERTLREAGRGEAVLEHRVQFQEAMRARFRQEVEQLTGRSVIGVMSGVQVEEPEMATQVFVLEPAPEAATD
jgi:uncharacterized protein YbcI